MNVTLDFDAQLARRALNEPRMELTEGEFGGRVGIWRLMELCSQHEIGLTMFVPGRICELYPRALIDGARRGFEIASHMWDHRVPADPEAQRDHLRRTTEALTATTGHRPIGQRAHGWRFDVLAELGYQYVSDYMADDRPYWATAQGATLLNLPFFWALDDAMYYKFGWMRGIPNAQRIADPETVYRIFLAAFERIHEMGGYMNITLHEMHSGRASRIAMLDRLFTEMRRREGVWFATCAQVVRSCPPRSATLPQER